MLNRPIATLMPLLYSRLEALGFGGLPLTRVSPLGETTKRAFYGRKHTAHAHALSPFA